MVPNENTTIIIKKIKKGGHGHHGGAWKVAYADFVTAMMAFFLLMWLINVSTDEQKEGIAEYFMPTFGVKGEVGNDKSGGRSAIEGNRENEKSPPGIVVGQVPQGETPEKPETQAQIQNEEDAQNFEDAKQEVKQAFEEDPNFRDFRDNIIVEQNPEGLKLQITDSDKYPMFDASSANLSQFGEQIMLRMAEVIKKMPNRISITGHTDATNYAPTENYTAWELSTDRANAARRFLIGKGDIGLTRVFKVQGMADQDLLLPNQPESPRNRRVTIILLRNSYLNLGKDDQSAPRGLLTVPKPTETIKAPIVPAPRKDIPAPLIRKPVEPPLLPVSPTSEKPAEPPISDVPGKTTGVSTLPGVMPQAPVDSNE
jgi:chemotaxis protein MotB